MDADPEGYFNSSMLFKATILTISFTTFYFYRQGQPLFRMDKPMAKQSTLAKVDNSKPAAKKKKKKTIYLTFDDGPCKGSKTVFSILKQEHIPATLFIIGEHVYGSKEQLAIYDSLKESSLIEIANHSYTHAFENKFYKFYNVPDSATKDFKRCADSLHFTSNIIRTPGRNIWRTENINSTDLKASTTAADSLQSNGFIAVGWDVEWHFNDTQRLVENDSEMVRNIDSAFARNETKTKNHLVLLTHDRTFAKPEDSAKLHRFITALKVKDEYDFEMVSEYPGLTKDTLVGR
jgi:peptidoglycan-N-acetylglucosamine deacetylase